MDSGASHHVTANLNNLSLYSDYGGPDEITIGDDAGLKIDHIGFSIIPTPTKNLTLSNVLQKITLFMFKKRLRFESAYCSKALTNVST